MTQAEVAGRLDVSAAYIQKIEAGKVNATLGQIERVAGGLDAYASVLVMPLIETADFDQIPVAESALERQFFVS